jgi:hypothetical protein
VRQRRAVRGVKTPAPPALTTAVDPSRRLSEGPLVRGPLMRVLAIGLAIAVIVFVVSGGHVLFLPLLFLPLGVFSLGHRHRRQRSYSARDRLLP